jgi:hypothetical protein
MHWDRLASSKIWVLPPVFAGASVWLLLVIVRSIAKLQGKPVARILAWLIIAPVFYVLLICILERSGVWGGGAPAWAGWALLAYIVLLPTTFFNERINPLGFTATMFGLWFGYFVWGLGFGIFLLLAGFPLRS